MSYVVKKRFLLLLGIIICTSRLDAMYDGEGVCPICGQFNFEFGTSFINVLNGEEIQSGAYENAHLGCLREQGLLKKTKESEAITGMIKSGGFMALAYGSTYALKFMGQSQQPSILFGCAAFLGTLCFLVQVGKYAKCKVENMNEHFSGKFPSTDNVSK